MKQLQFFSICFSVLLILVSCGGGSSGGRNDSSNTDTDKQTGLPQNINGLLTFGLYNSSSYVGLFVLDLKNGRIVENRLAATDSVHMNPSAFDRNTIVYVSSCGYLSTFLKTVSFNGLVAKSPLTPCPTNVLSSSKIGNISYGTLSPDKTKIAIQIYHDQAGDYTYYTSIYNVKTKKIIKQYKYYADPVWLSNGKLLLTASGTTTSNVGIYQTDINFSDNLLRIDNDQINQHIGTPSISPTKDRMVFTMSGQIWAMDMDGNNLIRLVTDNRSFVSPTWSPDGKYIAYLSYTSWYLQEINFYEVATGKKYLLNIKSLIPQNNINGNRPSGPLSWVK